MIPIPFLPFMIFSLTRLSKDNFKSSMRPKCFCSFTFDTTVPLKKERGGMDYFSLQENNNSVACLFGSGLNSLFH